jgi:hypothetical protein
MAESKVTTRLQQLIQRTDRVLAPCMPRVRHMRATQDAGFASFPLCRWLQTGYVDQTAQTRWQRSSYVKRL